MDIPKRIERRGKYYKFIKEYKNFLMYENEKTKAKVCFKKFDLGIKRRSPKPIHGRTYQTPII